MDQYLEISIAVEKKDAEAIESLMQSKGAYSVTIISTDDEINIDVAHPEAPQWKKQTLSGLYAPEFDVSEFSELIDQEIGQHIPIQQKLIQNQDWERVWLKGFKPIEIGTRLRICPSWIPPATDERINLIVDPGMAFGTGTHETTSLCLLKLDEMEISNQTVLDFGCGSGILSIAASKLGAAKVIGVDIDERAVTTTIENARINSAQSIVNAMSNEDFDAEYSAGAFDLVIANILAGTLVELSNYISKLVCGQGCLMLSGILRSQVETVISAYSGEFQFNAFYQNDWSLLVGSRKTS